MHYEHKHAPFAIDVANSKIPIITTGIDLILICPFCLDSFKHEAFEDNMTNNVRPVEQEGPNQNFQTDHPFSSISPFSQTRRGELHAMSSHCNFLDN